MKKYFSYAYIKSLPRTTQIVASVAIVAVGLLAYHFLTRPAPAADAPSQTAHVSIASVAGLSSKSGPLPVTGVVTSRSEATILAQSSGEIVSLYSALGDRVDAGDVIATFENSSQRAAVLQAQGAYDAANASLARVSGTGATNAGISSSQAAQGAANSLAALAAGLQSAYVASDDAVHTKADELFSNPRATNPILNFTTSDSQLTITLQNDRIQLESVISDMQKLAAGVTADNADASAEKAVADMRIIQTFLDNLALATNKAVTGSSFSATALAGAQASVGGARSEVSGSVSAVTGAKSAFDAARSGASVASNSANGGTANDIAAAQAGVKQAQGALDAARANLEKSVVRSPISGTIVSLPIHRGDFVGAFSQVAVVSNPGALEIVTNVTPFDAKSLVVGGKATIEGGVTGVIVSIAPALDPTTNKIEVKIGITSSAASLTAGETVSLTLNRTAKDTTSDASADITIPIIAAKITPEGPVVFTLSTSTTLVPHAIKLGSILGDKVVVQSGVTPDMEIVTDARGLAEGQKVIVDAQ